MKTGTMLRLLVIFFLAGAIGWASARRVSPEPPISGKPTSVRVDAPKKAAPPRTPEELARWTRERTGLVTDLGYSYGSEPPLTDWSTDELRAALAQGITDPAVVRYGSASKALHALMSEWTRRDPDAAWEWLQQLPSAVMRAMLGSALAKAWPADRAEEAFGFVVEHPDYFAYDGGYSYSPIIQKSFESAAARGPDAVDALMDLIQKNGMQYPIEGMKFPAGFDFAACARSPVTAAFLKRAGKHFFADAWMNQSPEEAFDGIIALNRENGTPITSGLFLGLKRLNEKEPEVMAERARRIGAQTGSLSSEEQALIIQAAAKDLSGEPALLRAYTNAIPDAETRAVANLTAASLMVSKDVPQALIFLEAGSAPETRLDLLEEYLTARPKDAFGWINGADEQGIRQTLTTWNASPERIDDLIKIIKRQKR
ncbi:hypothetical protein [Luteolibacter luteus]|uniref:Uncharacterized protein n=1 Tax=Luteolibacter luteus TaxID=2728835 RepID=A0A858RF39_9BACT|nr:hypothetical protein [Luteolibacter luteus]QJE95457.1 hypothetical protein HHL09_06565 [Luteolibacter luteus]